MKGSSSGAASALRYGVLCAGLIALTPPRALGQEEEGVTRAPVDAGVVPDALAPVDAGAAPLDAGVAPLDAGQGVDAPFNATGGAKQEAVYNRPFIVGQRSAALGGYAEANMNYIGEEGVDEGPSFEMRRFNLFVFSGIGRSLRFIAELEFEHGVEEIALETALLDVEIATELVLRAGVLLVPLGAFNQAHDGPIWDFIDRPLVSTTIIPATFSEIGVGAYGTLFVGPLDLDYQLYLTQGLADGVVDNDAGRVSIPAGRDGALFGEDSNSAPAVTGRLALRWRRVLEVGVSAWHGVYNTFKREAASIDSARALTIGALDLRLTLPWLEVRGEAAHAWIELPSSLRPTFGVRQWGLHVDAVAPVARFALLDFEVTTLEVGARFEHVDHNAGALASTGDAAGDEHTRLVGALAWRPGSETVFRLNYGYAWITDLIGNPPARRATIQGGFATYF